MISAWLVFRDFYSGLQKESVRAKSRQSCPTLCDPMDCTHQAPPSMGFSRQEYWSALSFPSSGDLPNLGIEPASLRSPALAGRFFTCSHWEAQEVCITPKLQESSFPGGALSGGYARPPATCSSISLCSPVHRPTESRGAGRVIMFSQIPCRSAQLPLHHVVQTENHLWAPVCPPRQRTGRSRGPSTKLWGSRPGQRSGAGQRLAARMSAPPGGLAL